MKFASLILLSFKRPEFLINSIKSIHENTKFPFELIVVDDGGSDEVRKIIDKNLTEGKISTAILNGGQNMGVGEGVKRGFAIACGDFLVKLDQDMNYTQEWLKKMIEILELDSKIGMVGGFKYNAQHPTVNFRKTNPEQIELKLSSSKSVKYWKVDDFVSSAFVIRTKDYKKFGEFPIGSEAFAEDIEYKKMLQKEGYDLALTEEDVLHNYGFGAKTSTIVINEEKGVVQTIAQNSKIFNN